MSAAQRQSTAKQASVKPSAQQRPPQREDEKEDALGKLLGLQAGFGNQAVKRAGDACPNLAACPTGGACHECGQKAAGGNGWENAGASHEPEPAPRETAPSQILRSAQDDSGGASAAQPTSFLVDDPASATEPAQMSKELFLSELRSQVSVAAEEELAGTGRTASDCPWIEYWFGYYEHRSAERVESALRQYASETATAQSAGEYMSPVVERVRRSVSHWAATGEVTGVPAEGLAAGAAGAALAIATQGLSAGLMFKAREGGAHTPQDLHTLEARLGDGEALDGPVRGRMESVFGADFGGVRVHRDAQAAALSSEVNARAFALGDHVAFGAGEYRPGNVVGDALIAHELAHVMQQQGGGASGGESADYGSLEADADRSAAGAVTSLWSGAREGLANMAARTGPALRSGLRLQRCNNSPREPAPAPAPAPRPDGCVTGNLTAVTSGPFQGGWNANSYLSGTSWGPVTDPGTAGPDVTGFKVQMTAPYSGNENLGVSQSLTFINANQAWRDDFAAYSGQPAGSVANGTSQNEPVLDATDPFASKPWFLRYKDGIASFCDVPRAAPGRQGAIDFLTTFHSRGAGCAHRRCSVVWRWTVDTTTATITNTVTQQSQSCQ